MLERESKLDRPFNDLWKNVREKKSITLMLQRSAFNMKHGFCQTVTFLFTLVIFQWTLMSDPCLGLQRFLSEGKKMQRCRPEMEIFIKTLTSEQGMQKVSNCDADWRKACWIVLKEKLDRRRAVGGTSHNEFISGKTCW